MQGDIINKEANGGGGSGGEDGAAKAKDAVMDKLGSHKTGSAVPRHFQDFVDRWNSSAARETVLASYGRAERSFVAELLPEQAVQLSADDTLALLRRRLGQRLDMALDHRNTDPSVACSDLPAELQSPVRADPNPDWLRRTNMVGINVRTIGSFWNVIKYALTLPEAHDAIHILPIWEPGVVQSLYGPSSWQINPEFLSRELAQARPRLDTVERQLRAIVNILHAMGRTVGMDVIPHTDRFSQMALAFPHYFEWLRRQDVEIVDHRSDLHEEVQQCIFAFLQENGSATPGVPVPESCAALFADEFPEDRRLLVLFGLPADYAGRAARRGQIVKQLHKYGYEPVPATMAPPYRGLKVDSSEEAKTVDAQGLLWRDFLITRPQFMSRVFNPLGRYKLYERRDDNVNWEVAFKRPRSAVWRYVCDKYLSMQRAYGFDFMRGDMSHVQMRPNGVPHEIDEYYDILRAVRNHVRENGAPYFGYHAESFLPAADVMAYGDEIDHLEASEADTALGDLQSTCVGSAEFLQRFRWYLDLKDTRSVTPTFTVMTGDKDDPRFDKFYVKGSPLRMFVAFFLADMPSYMGLGFETRDVHYQPAPNEHYTKLFVFHEHKGPKSTVGPYVWGKNGCLFSTITRMRLYLDKVWSEVKDRPTRWLLTPDATAETKLLAWTQQGNEPDFVFVCNTDTDNAVNNIAIPQPTFGKVGAAKPVLELELEFSTAVYTGQLHPEQRLTSNGRCYRLAHLGPGEARAYRILRG